MALPKPPAEVKMAVCGHGAAAKPEVQKMTKVLLRLAEIPKPDDAADALAVAICHVNRAPLAAAFAGCALRPGDVVTRVNDRPVERPDQFIAVWDSLSTAKASCRW